MKKPENMKAMAGEQRAGPAHAQDAGEDIDVHPGQRQHQPGEDAIGLVPAAAHSRRG